MKAVSVALAVLMVTAGLSVLGSAWALDPMDPSDAQKDADNDGLCNLEEYLLGCDPLNADTDNDGIPDGWEGYFSQHPTLYDYDNDGVADTAFVEDVMGKGYIFDPCSALNILDDPDDDGWNNLREYQEGTDPSNPNTDWDARVKDSEDPQPFVPDKDYRAIFGGSYENPYVGPGPSGRAPFMPAMSPVIAPVTVEGAGMAYSFADAMSQGVLPGDVLGSPLATAVHSNGRTLKYLTRVVVDSALPTVIAKGDAFSVSGHVEYTTIQVDDGQNNQGNNNGNNGQQGQNGQNQQQQGNNPGQQQGGNQGQPGQNGQNQQGGNPGQQGGQQGGNNPGQQPGPGGNPGQNQQGGNPGQQGGQQGGGPGQGTQPGQGDGGQDGQGHGTGGTDPANFYWYWWHGHNGRSTGGREELKWSAIDQPMTVSIQLNTTKGNYIIGTGNADLLINDVYGYFQITCIVPGAAPAGDGKIVVHACANSYFSESWWEEGRDG